MYRLANAFTGKKIKIGLDIHGVIDQAPEFFSLFSMFPDVFELHIVTGIKEHLDDVVDFKYDKWFSIHQQCEDEGIDITFDDKGRPWVEPAIWDRKKAEYCKREGLHMMIDDSPSYGQYFKGLETLYLRLENGERDNWRQDGQHVDSPVLNIPTSIKNQRIEQFLADNKLNHKLGYTYDNIEWRDVPHYNIIDSNGNIISCGTTSDVLLVLEGYKAKAP